MLYWEFDFCKTKHSPTLIPHVSVQKREYDFPSMGGERINCPEKNVKHGVVIKSMMNTQELKVLSGGFTVTKRSVEF